MPTQDLDNPFAAPLEDPSQVVQLPLATRRQRLIAKVLDHLVHGFTLIPVAIVASVLAGSTRSDLGLVLALPMSLLFLAVPAYNWYLTATQGLTIGKRAMSLMVVEADGSPVGFLRGVLLRSWILWAAYSPRSARSGLGRVRGGRALRAGTEASVPARSPGGHAGGPHRRSHRGRADSLLPGVAGSSTRARRHDL